MTIEEAKDEVGERFEDFVKHVCSACRNDWYCPSYCALLEKMAQMDFNRILEKVAHYDGDIVKVTRWASATKT